MKPLVIKKKIPAVFPLLLILAGCELYGRIGGDGANIQGTLPELLRGEWVYTPPGSGAPAERYFIEGDTIWYNGGGYSEYDYEGTIEFVSNYSADSGVIIIEYARRPSYFNYNDNPFTAIYYKNLKKDTVQMANVIKLGGNNCADTITLDEAIQKFTRLQTANFVDWSVVQPQTRVR
jgi:hypothetical protein